MRSWIGDPLHPGGDDATRSLLDAADVGPGTRLVDLGCGAGDAVRVARTLGADAVGLDRDGPVCADLTALPLADGSVDVAVSECALCLADDLEQALAEARRVLVPAGRLAFSDVTLEAPLPEVPPVLADPLCLSTARPRDALLDAVGDAGFSVREVADRSADLHGFRRRVRSRVDVDGLLDALGADAAPVRSGVRTIEAALEDGTLGYVHVVARR